MNKRGLIVLLAASVVGPSVAGAVGEPTGGFPNWQERVIHQWINRARAAPAADLAKCTAGNCGDSSCYLPIAPLGFDLKLSRAARFHSDEMQRQGYAGLNHSSECTIVPNIDALYPTQCSGVASCACVGGTKSCSPTCQSFSARIQLFGGSPSGEIIAGGTDPNAAFYLWLYEQATNTACMYTSDKGHRWNILKAGPAVGAGMTTGPLYGGTAVGVFGSGAAPAKIPSGTHYPQRGTQVEAWASYYDTQAPMQALVNVDGKCTNLTVARGGMSGGMFNAAYSAMLTGLNATTCARYVFQFKDAAGADVTYPTTGSLGIGPATCADWNTARPGTCGCTPQCSGLTCGDDGCGGTCGTCDSNANCQAGQCVGPPGADGGNADGGSPDGITANGCSCHLTGPGTGGNSLPWLAMGLAGLVLGGLRARRRQRG